VGLLRPLWVAWLVGWLLVRALLWVLLLLLVLEHHLLFLELLELSQFVGRWDAAWPAMHLFI
jgi:hypothetical protein